MRPAFLAAAFALAFLGGPAAADPVEGFLAEARAACAGFENGVFDAADAVIEVDLDGQPPMDRLVDESKYGCSTAASLYCGSGGCMLHAVIGEESWSFQSTGWRMLDWGPARILLIGRDGGWCGGSGAEVCFEAVNWSFGRMMTVMPPS
jgi:hypothetical protein